ncbi:MAG: hypothetical protein LBS30_07065 [Planctomycetota bacterium]|nr:hypothetical protein [Planctomycetota bacterium]
MNFDYSNLYASNAYRAQASQSATTISGTASFFEVTGDASGSKYAKGAGGADSVELSDTVNEMLERIRSLDVFSCIFPNNDVRQKTKTLDEVESDFMADFNDFSSAFGQMSQMMGMADGDSMMMGLDGVGGMTFDGNNEALNQKMADFAKANPTMTARYALMAARASLADAGYTLDGFADAYKQDPVKAIQDNIGALKERLLGFRTIAEDGKMQYGFQREVDFEYSETTSSYETTAA